MFNVTILRMKDILKYIFIIIIATIAVIILLKVIQKRDSIKNINTSMPQVLQIEEKGEENKKENEKNETEYMKEIIESQISSIKETEDTNNTQTQEEQTKEQTENESTQNQEQEKVEEKANIESIPNTLQTEVVTQNPIQENYNTQYGKVKIRNSTDYTLTEEMLLPNIQIENKNVIIFHTHTCESYTASDNYPYTPTGNFRTTDLNYSVARVGTELENNLKQYNINVLHNVNYHDYPAYNGSYTRSLETVTNCLKSNPSDIIIDLHRDAIGSRSDYAPTIRIGDEYAAQIMFVIGTDNGGLEHKNWNSNLKFAIKVQEKAEEMYPNLFKPIILRKSRYNQHLGKYANIIEVGATGNTLDQCITSMKYLSKVLNEVMK